jgi:adenylate cyclase
LERRLTTILAADVVGYSRLMGDDEAGTLTALKSLRRELVKPKESQYRGRTVKLMGDGALMEFASVVDAVAFAVEVQVAMAKSYEGVPEDRRIVYRMGINIGDIIVEGDDIYGDGVNVAARLEGLSEPGGVCVSRNVFNQVKGKLDLTFEHLGEKEVKNIAEPVSVYRVVLDDKAAALVTPLVQEAARPKYRRWQMVAGAAIVSVLTVGAALWWRPWAPDIEPASLDRMAFPLPDEASIAVLPFKNLSDDPEQNYFTDGLTNDIITDLSKMKDLFVIASNSTFTYKDKPVKVQQVAEDLGVRYVLEGSVQRTGNKIRINAQLIDATSGRHLWADRYDRDAGDLFAVQTEIIEMIVATLAFKVDTAERERVLRKDTENLAAYELYRRGREAFFIWTKDSMAEARVLCEKAIQIDPNYAKPYGLLARILGNQARYGWVEDPDGTRDLAVEMGLKAVVLNPDDYYSHWELGGAYMFQGDFNRSIAEYKRALDLNPNDADLLAEMVELLVKIGRAEDAVARVKSAMRINPHYPDWYLWNLGWAQYFAGQYEEALDALNQMSNPPNGVRRHIAAVLVRLGRIVEAREAIEAFVANAPDYTLADEMATHWQHRAYLEQLIDDLRIAGLPE